MQGVYGQRAVTAKARIIAIAMFVSLFVLFLLPTSAFAEEVPSSENTTELPAGPTVQAPGTPSATSANDTKNIVWVWSAPAGGLTPDAVVVEGEVPAEQPTDIIQYGYELSKGSFVSSGTVGSDVTTLTTPVSEDGTYTFNIWSITRAGAVSDPVTTTMTVLTPIVLPPVLPPIETPAVILPIPAISAPTSNTDSSTNPPVTTSSDTSNNTYNTGTAKVLSAADEEAAPTQSGTVGVITPSKQGWVLAGVAWYVWLLAVGVMFFVGRFTFSFIKNLQ